MTFEGGEAKQILASQEVGNYRLTVGHNWHSGVSRDEATQLSLAISISVGTTLMLAVIAHGLTQRKKSGVFLKFKLKIPSQLRRTAAPMTRSGTNW